MTADDEKAAELAWAREIERRARLALSGESQGHEWRQVYDEIAAELAASEPRAAVR